MYESEEKCKCGKEATLRFDGVWYCYDCYYIPEATFNDRINDMLEDRGDGGV